MARLNDIVDYCNDLLQADAFADFCPNGLQLEGRQQVDTLLSGVTASRALIERAIEERADAILVHHGLFWKGEDARLTGMKFRRLKALIENGIGLIAYHLPLDAHPRVGNNAQLALRFGLEQFSVLGEGEAKNLFFHAELPKPLSGDELARQIERSLNRPPLHIDGGPALIRKIGWCTGAAQSFIDQAATLGLDAYISGEVSEQTTHA
ncbi:MAG: Nif3-like dinuclear metal center hexameric protein, partial [Gammaproteobacteria bacterium]|nr:Nif3-like dinuclear metal center hexameric protein [Gammaproteobacteria bacterium]